MLNICLIIVRPIRTSTYHTRLSKALVCPIPPTYVGTWRRSQAIIANVTMHLPDMDGCKRLTSEMGARMGKPSLARAITRQASSQSQTDRANPQHVMKRLDPSSVARNRTAGAVSWWYGSTSVSDVHIPGIPYWSDPVHAYLYISRSTYIFPWTEDDKPDIAVTSSHRPHGLLILIDRSPPGHHSPRLHHGAEQRLRRPQRRRQQSCENTTP